jgi:hypothetical protein
VSSLDIQGQPQSSQAPTPTPTPQNPQAQQPLAPFSHENWVPREVYDEIAKFEAAQKASVIGGNVSRFGASIGTGFVDATLGLVHGALGLANIGNSGWDFQGDFPKATGDLLGPDAERNLVAQSTRLWPFVKTAGETGGHVLGFVAGAPGKLVEVAGLPGAIAGAKIAAKIPQLGKLGQLAAKTLPGMMASATGFGVENFVASDGQLEDRATSLLAGMGQGAMFHVVSSFGTAVGNKILARGLSQADKQALQEAMDGLRDPSKLTVKTINKVMGTGAAALFEGTAFSMMSADWWNKMLGGDFSGAMAEWSGTVPAVFAARYGHADAHLFVPRLAPDQNSLAVRLQAEMVREQKASAEKRAADIAALPTGQHPQPLMPGAAEQQAAQAFEQTVGSVANTLFRSGWRETQDPNTPIVFKTESGGEVPLYSAGQEAPVTVRSKGDVLEMDVPEKVYRAVTKDAEHQGDVTLTGDAAKKFAGDLTLLSLFRKIQAESVFGGTMKEIGAGFGWKDTAGREHQIGIDGAHYSRSIPAEASETWKKELDIPPPQEFNALGNNHLQLSRWAEAVDAFAKIAPPSRELDVLRAAVHLARTGNLDNPSVQEVVKLLAAPMQQGALNADLIATMLRPNNLPFLAWQVGAVASGHSNANIARLAIVNGLSRMQQGMPASGASEAAAPSAEGTAAPSAEGDQVPRETQPPQESLVDQVESSFSGPIPTVRRKGPAVEVAPAAQQRLAARLEELNAAAAKTEADVPTKIGDNTVRYLKNWATPKRSGGLGAVMPEKLRKWMIGLQPGEQVVPANIIRQFAEANMPEKFQRMREDASGDKQKLDFVESHIQAIETLVGKLVEPQVRADRQVAAKKAEVTAQLAEIAGSQDWRQVSKGDRKAAAEKFVQTAMDGGVEVFPRDLIKTFGMKDTSARRLLSDMADAAKAAAPAPASEPAAEANKTVPAPANFGREGEAGSALNPLSPEARKGAAETVRSAFRILREGGELYASGAPEMVGRHAGAVGTDFGQKARASIDASRRFQDAAEPLRREAETKIHRPGVAKFLERTMDTGDGKQTFLTELMHGRQILDETGNPVDVPQPVADAVKALQDLVFKLGEQGQQAGAVRYRHETGTFESFTPTPGGKILPRTTGKDLETIKRNDVLRTAFAEKLARDNPGVSESAIADILKPSDVKSTPLERQTAYEKIRTLRNVPDIFDHNGKSYEVFDTNPGDVVNRLFHSETMRSGVIEVFGQDLPAEARQALGIEKPGITAAVSAYKGALEGEPGSGEARRMAGRVDRLVELLHGINTGGPPMALRQIEGFFRSVEVFTSFVYDVGDLGVAGPTLVGPMRLLRTLVEIGKNPKDAFLSIMAEAKRMNSAMAEAGDLTSRFTDLIRLPSRWSEATKVAVLKMQFRNVVKDMKSGSFAEDPWLQSLVRLTDFSATESAAMLRGEGGKLYDALINRAVALSTGNYLPGEGSFLHANKTFNYLLAYNRFFMGRMRMAGKLSMNIGQPGGGRAALTFLAGSLASGAIGQYLGYVLQQWSIEKGTEKWLREIQNASANPIDALLYVGKTASVNLLGGSLFSMAKGFFSDPNYDVTRSVSPLNRLREVVMAAPGWGPYASQSLPERAITLAERMPLVPRVLRAALASGGLGEGDFGTARMEFNSWRKQVGLPMGAPGDVADIRYAPFRDAMRSMRTMVRANEEAKPEDLLKMMEPSLKAALQVAQGSDISSSLLGMRMVNRLDEAKREEMVRAIGPDNARKLYTYDRALEMLAHAYRDMHGSDKLPQRQFSVRLDNTVEQVHLGGTDAWKPLFDDTIEAEVARFRAGGEQPSEDLTDLANSASALPETLDRVLSEREFAMLNGLSRADAGMLLQSLLWKKVISRVKDEMRSEAKAATR